MRRGALPPGWRISEEYSESKQADYVQQVVEELKAVPRIKREVPTHFKGIPVKELTGELWEEFVFSQQPKSTQEAITAQKTRKPEDDIDHLLRPMPACVANPEAATLDELTAKRQLGIEETLLVEDIRHKGRNTLGQSDSSSVDTEKRQRGIEAFTYSKPAALTDAQIKKLTKLEEIVNTPLEPEPPAKTPWWKKLWNNPATTRTLTREELDEYFGRK